VPSVLAIAVALNATKQGRFTHNKEHLEVKHIILICCYMSFFDPEASLVIRRGKLPHWRQEGAIYFVTFHLVDSLPQTKLDWLRREKELWLHLNPEPHTHSQQREYHERFIQTVDRWLDAGYGRCILAQPNCKTIMESSLLHFDGVRYELGEFVVMPNHVHAIVAPIGDCQLTRILHSWKSFSAHEFNRVLTSSTHIWHRESFDHIIRSAEHLAKFEAYIRNNAKPKKAQQ
jgi:REP element-mobilizing transposase RayT